MYKCCTYKYNVLYIKLSISISLYIYLMFCSFTVVFNRQMYTEVRHEFDSYLLYLFVFVSVLNIMGP